VGTILNPPIRLLENSSSVFVVAEFTETASTICIEGRVTEISCKTCYVNTPSTFPVNTLLKVFISHDGRTFKTSAKVIFEHARFGMGIVFVDSAVDQLEILNSWLADAA
jgi:hypothetical protein